METWRAIMGGYPYGDAASKASRYGVLDDESERLQQPLIGGHDDGPYGYYNLDGTRTPEEEEEGDDDLMEEGRLLHKPTSARRYDDVPLKPSSTAVLRSIVTHVLWPMTAVGAQTAKVFEARSAAAAAAQASYEVDDRHAMRAVPTLRALIKPRRRAETLDEIHEKALVRIAVVTLVFSAWLIITVYRNAD